MPPESRRDFRAVQEGFTRWLRHPAREPVPAGIAQRRLDTYRELLLNNVTSFVEIAFPVARALLPEALWTRLTGSFFSDHRCRSAFFHDISLHFREHVEGLAWPELAGYPWLRELLHFEWMELVADIAETPPPRTGHPGLPASDNMPLQLNVPVWPLAYQWRVHVWRADTPPESLTPSPVALLLWRDTNLDLRTHEVAPAAAWLIEQLAGDEAHSLATLASGLREAAGIPTRTDALALVRTLLSDLADHGIRCH